MTRTPRLLPALVIPALVIPALLLAAAPAPAQLLRQDPAANSQPPPATAPSPTQASPPVGTMQPRGTGERGGAPSNPRGASESGGSPGDSQPMTRPPQDRNVVPAPAVPGATRPDSSTGIFDLGNSPIPPRPGARPDASTTAPPDRR